MKTTTSEKRLAETLGVPVKISRMNIRGHTINFLKAGSGSALLLIHGGNIGWGQWYPNIPAFSQHFTVYALDLPGAGRSGKIDYNTLQIEDFVEIVALFIDKLNIKELHIVGSSIGGWITLKLALSGDTRIKKIVVADALGFSTYASFSDRIIGFYPLAKLLSKTVLKPTRNNKNIETFLRSVFYNTSLPLKEEFIDYFYDTMSISHNLLFISKLSSIFGMRSEFNLISQLADIKNKTLIVWGEKDVLMPLAHYEENFTEIPDMKLSIISDAGHIPSIEKAQKFNRVVVDFLKG